MDTVRFDFDDAQGNLLTMTKRLDTLPPTVHIFELSGRLDAVRTDAAIEQVHTAIADGARKVLLDLSDVTFLSSSGLRALLLA